jgi:predicted transcriptional regulator
MFCKELTVATTSIRLPDDLKARIADAAKQVGTTTHSFILAAIAEKAEQVELRADMEGVAAKRYADIVASGETIGWDDMRAYLKARIAGKAVKAPLPRKFGS